MEKKFDILFWVQKDFWSIIIILCAIFLCIYSLYHIKDVETRTNEKWNKVFKEYCPQYVEEDIINYFEVADYNASDHMSFT